MAKRFLTNIDLSSNQLIGSSFEQVATDPIDNLFNGRMVYNTTDEQVKVYTPTNGWISAGATIPAGLTKKAAQSVGDDLSTTFQIAHNLGTTDVIVSVYDNVSLDIVECSVVITDENSITVSFYAAPAVDKYRVVVIG